MTRNDIRSHVIRILTDDFSVERELIEDDAHFTATLGLDSLDVVDFILLLQKDFGYRAEPSAYHGVDNVEKLVRFLEERVGAKA